MVDIVTIVLTYHLLINRPYQPSYNLWGSQLVGDCRRLEPKNPTTKPRKKVPGSIPTSTRTFQPQDDEVAPNHRNDHFPTGFPMKVPEDVTMFEYTRVQKYIITQQKCNCRETCAGSKGSCCFRKPTEMWYVDDCQLELFSHIPSSKTYVLLNSGTIESQPGIRNCCFVASRTCHMFVSTCLQKPGLSGIISGVQCPMNGTVLQPHPANDQQLWCLNMVAQCYS